MFVAAFPVFGFLCPSVTIIIHWVGEKKGEAHEQMLRAITEIDKSVASNNQLRGQR